ncbi:unnamed protein product, partial [Symbiodinium necroappetens]
SGVQVQLDMLEEAGYHVVVRHVALSLLRFFFILKKSLTRENVAAGLRRCCHHAVAFHFRLADAQNTPANASAAVLAGKELQSLACLELDSCAWVTSSVAWAQTHGCTQQHLDDLPPEGLEIVSLFQSPRQRLMMGLLCAVHGRTFLQHGLVDTSQSIQMCQVQLHADSGCKSISTTSAIFHCGKKMFLGPGHMAAVLGFPPEMVKALHKMGQCNLSLACSLVGNSMHVPTLACSLWALLSSITEDSH